MHQVDLLAVVRRVDVQDFCRASLHRFLQDLHLAFLVHSHVPDSESARLAADCHVDLLVLVCADGVNAMDCDSRLLTDVGRELAGEEHLRLAHLAGVADDSRDHRLVVHGDARTDITVKCNGDDLPPVLYQCGTLRQASRPLGRLLSRGGRGGHICADRDEFDLRCTRRDSIYVDIGHLGHVLVLELTCAELVEAFGWFFLAALRCDVP